MIKELDDIIDRIDADIRDIIWEINQTDLIRTTGSCSGHYELCKGYYMKLRGCDDNNLEYYDDMKCESRYCTWTMQPYLSFRIIDGENEAVKKFMEGLHNSPRCFPYSVLKNKKIANEWTYGYSDADEGYDCSCDGLALKPKFKEFWTHFLDLWKTHMNPKSALTADNMKFLVHYKCTHDAASNNYNDTINGPVSCGSPPLLAKSHSWFDTELYSTDHLEYSNEIEAIKA